MILGRPLDWVCGRRGVLPADPRQRIGKRRLEAPHRRGKRGTEARTTVSMSARRERTLRCCNLYSAIFNEQSASLASTLQG
jgi:hypothetical protein